MRLIWIGILILMALAAEAKKKKTPRPTVTKTGAPTPRPVFRFTAAQYAYYANLYYDRATFIYENFPHTGPSFAAAQLDMAKSRFYSARAKAAADAE